MWPSKRADIEKYIHISCVSNGGILYSVYGWAYKMSFGLQLDRERERANKNGTKAKICYATHVGGGGDADVGLGGDDDCVLKTLHYAL